MIYFLFQIIIHTMAVAITIFLLPGVYIESNGVLTYMLLGALFGLLNTFIRPIIVFVTGRLAIRTLGLSQIFVHSVLFLLLSLITEWLTPGLLIVNSVWLALLGGLIIGGVLVLLDIVLGLDRPILDELEYNPFYLSWFKRLPSKRRDRIIESLRFQSVYNILWRYGMEMLANNSPFWRIRALVERVRHPHAGQIDIPSTPYQVRVMLQQLGPTYVKIGQMISSRSNGMPQDWQRELAKLQSSVPSFPEAVAVEIIESELKQPLDQLFGSFDLDPLAAASTAQIHRATLPDGTSVVVKVQRPNIVTKVKADLGIINEMIGSLEKQFEALRDANAGGIFSEFATEVMLELDYENELFNARHLGRQFEGFSGVRVPKVFGQLSTGKVLVMSYEQGVKITNVSAIEAAGLNRTQLAKTYIGAMMKQILFDGFFHSDPHPGNVLVDMSNGDIVFLDMGMMGELDRQQRLDLLNLLWSLSREDSDGLAKVLLRLSTRYKPVDEALFKRQVERMVDRYLVYAEESDSLSQIIDTTLGIMSDAGLRINSKLTLALKALAQSEEILARLDPTLYLVQTALDELKEIFLNGNIELSHIANALGDQLVNLTQNVLLDQPSNSQATQNSLPPYPPPPLTMEMYTNSLDQQVKALNRAVNWLMVGLLMIGMIGGSALATLTSTSVFGVSLSLIAFVLFILSIGFSFVLVIQMVRRQHVDSP